MAPLSGRFPRRIAYSLIPHFPLAVEFKADPSLVGLPVVIGGEPYQDHPVLDASPEAIQQGVWPGMPLHHAYSLCPEARFLPRDIPKYRRAFEEVLCVLDAFSPQVEPEGLGSAFLDMTGSEALLGPDATMARRIGEAIREGTRLGARVGIAGTKFAARVAVLGSDGSDTTVVPPGEEAFFLGSFPIEMLTDDPEMVRRLRLLGIERVGDYRELPSNSVAVQFGKEGQIAYQLALGVDNHPVWGKAQPPSLEIQRAYEEPIDNQEWLFAQVDLLLESLAVQLDEGGWMCQRVELRVELGDDRFQENKVLLAAPTASVRELQERARRALGGQVYGAPIRGIWIALLGLTTLQGKQLSLETMPIRQRKRLQAAVEYLKVKYGPGRIKMARLLNPKALAPSQRFVLMEYGEVPERDVR